MAMIALVTSVSARPLAGSLAIGNHQPPIGRSLPALLGLLAADSSSPLGCLSVKYFGRTCVSFHEPRSRRRQPVRPKVRLSRSPSLEPRGLNATLESSKPLRQCESTSVEISQAGVKRHGDVAEVVRLRLLDSKEVLRLRLRILTDQAISAQAVVNPPKQLPVLVLPGI